MADKSDSCTRFS